MARQGLWEYGGAPIGKQGWIPPGWIKRGNKAPSHSPPLLLSPADVVLGCSSAPLALSRRPMQLLLDRFLYTDGSVQGLWQAMDLAGGRIRWGGSALIAACAAFNAPSVVQGRAHQQ